MRPAGKAHLVPPLDPVERRDEVLQIGKGGQVAREGEDALLERGVRLGRVDEMPARPVREERPGDARIRLPALVAGDVAPVALERADRVVGDVEVGAH